jgi:formate hydrogenlyase subunit 3/multisubunit Na+/H+ antiporter MnhD subunit
MDLRRLRTGEWLAAISAVALLTSLFLPWYEVGRAGPGGWTVYGPHWGSSTATGWESFSAIDILLALVAASGVLLAIVTAHQRVPAVPVALSALVALVGIVGVILVLIRVLDLPDWADGREWGLWLALAGAVGIVAGSLLAMREEIRPRAEAIQIESLPAPRP